MKEALSQACAPEKCVCKVDNPCEDRRMFERIIEAMKRSLRADQHKWETLALAFTDDLENTSEK